MKVIVDFNKIFSALTPISSAIREILIRGDDDMFAPNFIVIELFEKKEKLLKSTKLTNGEFYSFLHLIIERITFVALERIDTIHIENAWELCKDVDEKDFAYVALTLELNGQFWTGDKKLINGLRAKGFDQFFES